VAFLGGQATGALSRAESFMRRRNFVTAALAATAWPALARAQDVASTVAIPIADGPIEPATPLEFAFVSALTNERMRPIFRRYLLDTSIALALTEEGSDEPLEVEVREGWRGGAIFTTAARLDSVLGEDAPRIMLNGRAALERLRGKNAVLNYRLVPMLTLDNEDVAVSLATEGSASAGPTQ
jgi:hypothetical protein